MQEKKADVLTRKIISRLYKEDYVREKENTTTSNMAKMRLFNHDLEKKLNRD